MRHPFDGINEPTVSTRRGILGMLAAAAGYFGFGSLAHAAAPPTSPVRVLPEASPEPMPMTKALGEDGKKPIVTLAVNEEGKVTTLAVGEEGGPRVTTKAVGEEGGKLTKALREDGKLTGALREGGGVATTLAVGEEGGKKE